MAGRLVRLVIAIGITGASGAQIASAALFPVSQARSLATTGSIDDGVGGTAGDSDADSAPDFGPFDEGAGLSLQLSSSTVDAFASQLSAIGAGEVTGDGLADTFVTAGDGEFSDGTARSSFALAFVLSTAQLWRIDSALSGFGTGFGGATLALSFEGSPIVSLDTQNGDDGIRDVLSLSPGSYELEAEASASAFAFGDSRDGRATFSFRFSEVPEPASSALLALGLVALAAFVRTTTDAATRASRPSRRGPRAPR